MQKRIFFFLMVVLCSSVMVAQEHLLLSLEEAQSVALEHNRTLKNASLDVRKSHASRWQTIATMLPQVSASVDYSSQFGYQLNFGGNPITMLDNYTYGGKASIAFSGAQLVGVKLQDIAIKMANITLKQTEKETKDQVKTLYYSALVMDQTTKLLEKTLENLNKLLVFTEQSVNVGVSEQTDADQISVRIADLQTNISSSKRAMEMLFNSMRLQLGVDVDTEIELSQTIDDLFNDEKALTLVENDFNMEDNFDYQLLNQNLSLSGKQVSAKIWAFAPSLSAFYQYSKKEYFKDEATFDMTPPNMLGISLSIPIFSSGSRLAAVKEAKLEHEKQRNNFENTQEALVIQHRQLRYNLRSSYESFETQKKNIVVVQRVFDNISRKYEHGMASSMDVTNSGTELIAAQSSYVQALLDVVNAQVELEKLLNIDSN